MGLSAFRKPVFLQLATGTFRASSPWEALDYLDHFWTGTITRHYELARRLCQEALDGFVDNETARRALLDAAQRARLLVSRSRLPPLH